MRYFKDDELSSDKVGNKKLAEFAKKHKDNSAALFDILDELQGRTGKKPSIVVSNDKAQKIVIGLITAISEKPEIPQITVSVPARNKQAHLPNSQELATRIKEAMDELNKKKVVPDPSTTPWRGIVTTIVLLLTAILIGVFQGVGRDLWAHYSSAVIDFVKSLGS